MNIMLGLSSFALKEVGIEMHATAKIIRMKSSEQSIFFMLTTEDSKFLNVDPKGAEAFLSIGEPCLEVVVPGFKAEVEGVFLVRFGKIGRRKPRGLNGGLRGSSL